LAAARTHLLPPQALLGRLGQRLAVLTGGARDLPDRQRTLRATIAWSHDLLTTEEQALFRRLAVFAGGATLEAAEAVCDPDSARDILGGLAALVDRSLLRQADTGDRAQPDGGEPRVTMLEALHEYAVERLEASGEAEVLRGRHAAYYLTLAEAAAPGSSGAAQATWLARRSSPCASNSRSARRGCWRRRRRRKKCTGH
jgi:predicted ATPase